MQRVVQPEWLDQLPCEDLLALGSRRDLRRLNWVMGHVSLMAQALKSVGGTGAHGPVADLGAGDGQFLLRVARRWRGDGPRRAILVDRQPLPQNHIYADFALLGWQVEFIGADVFDWLKQLPPGARLGLVTNLFLHHFGPPELSRLLEAIAQRATFFIALEPRRSIAAALASRALGLLGCNRVTRHDAPVSVQAGFKENELSRVWPDPGEWVLQERPAGVFSHLFIARRTKNQVVGDA